MIKASMRSDIGVRRASNQDFAYVSCRRIGTLPNLFLVADGMGGHKAGDFASSYAVTKFVEFVKKKKGLPAAVLQEAICHANLQLNEKTMEDERLKGAGTTLAVAVVEDQTLYAANVGDSRIYVAGRDFIRQVTRDHSYVEELVALGRIQRGSEEYLRYKNIITRAVGTRDSVNPDLFEVDLFETNYILLCSDGLTNMVSDSDILQILNSDRTVEDKTAYLVQLANDNGGSDNITVVLAQLN